MQVDNNIAELHEKVYRLLSEKWQEDNTIRFTLRERNHNNKIDNHFWFYGSDDYIIVSFWEGKDWQNNRPNIYLTIFKDEKVYLNFSSKDDLKKQAFFKDIADSLNIIQERVKKTGELHGYWVKPYNIDNLETTLNSNL